MPFLGESHSQTLHLPNRKGGSNRSSAMIQCRKSALSMPKKDCRHRVCSSCCVVANAAICKLDVQHILLYQETLNKDATVTGAFDQLLFARSNASYNGISTQSIVL